jgi:hypothetical protein
VNGITPAQRGALAAVAPALEPGTYLAGGVAVALVLEHRASLDLGLFVPEDFDADRLAERISATVPRVRVMGRARGTLHLEIDGVPTSILSYRYPTLVAPAVVAQLPVPLASLEDLVCMKLSAIAGRGAAKDFWDLDALLAHGATAFGKKYRSEDIGHVVRSLAYFGDADAAGLPAGLDPAAWQAVKQRMLERVRAL